MSAPAFAAAFAEGDPRTLAANCLTQLPQGQQANLGILYISEPTAPANTGPPGCRPRARPITATSVSTRAASTA